MKFGRYLSENRIWAWKEHYVAYKSFKKFIAMSEANHGPGDTDFFIHKIEENVRKIETWYLEVRNDCMKEFEKIKKELPIEVKNSLQFSDYISFDNRTDFISKKKKKKHKKKQNTLKKNENKQIEKKTDNLESEKEEFEKSNKTSIDDEYYDDESSEFLPSEEYDNEDEEVKMHDEKKQKEDSFLEYFGENRDINGNIILPVKTLIIENQVFSHLPPSAHTSCLKILLTLGKLKLFGWQNSEGIRKIIKKFDKRFEKKLSTTLWPKIRKNEFCLELKHDGMIEQVANVLLTRTIPFGHFDSKTLREKGVNLRQMATAIMQLDNVTNENLKEIIPMSVEPRSYLSNERTFLKWIRMSAFGVLVGMILIAMRHEPVTGVITIIISLAILIRSYHEYYKRNDVLVNRVEHNWIDPIGPKLLVLGLLLPMTTYIVYLIRFGSTTNVFHK